MDDWEACGWEVGGAVAQGQVAAKSSAACCLDAVAWDLAESCGCCAQHEVEH